VKYACECVKILGLNVSYNSHMVLEIDPLKIALDGRIIGHVLA